MPKREIKVRMIVTYEDGKSRGQLNFSAMDISAAIKKLQDFEIWIDDKSKGIPYLVEIGYRGK